MQQLAFDLPVRTAHGRDDFMVAPANEAAVALVDAWPNWPGPMAALCGPAGSGKTHLAEVWRHKVGAQLIALQDLVVERVPDIILHGRIVIEDVGETGLPEKALFHLFNLAGQQGASVLLTSRHSPAYWDVSLPDLRSRLRSIPVASLGLPDDQLLRALLIKQFNDRQIEVDESVITYLMTRMERSSATAAQIVAGLDAAALASQSRMSRNFVAKTLPGLMNFRD